MALEDFYVGSDYDAYQPYEAPTDYGGWSGDQGWDTGGFAVDNSLPMGYDWTTDMTGMGFGAPQQDQYDPSLIQAPQGEYGWNPQLAQEPAPPSVGQQGPGGLKEDDWLNQLKKTGLGVGASVLAQGAGAGLQALMAPKQQQQRPQGMPQPSAGRQYTPEPLEPLPGTKASPLISGRPTQVRGSAGLKERRPGYGGFSLY